MSLTVKNVLHNIKDCIMKNMNLSEEHALYLHRSNVEYIPSTKFLHRWCDIVQDYFLAAKDLIYWENKTSFREFQRLL